MSQSSAFARSADRDAQSLRRVRRLFMQMGPITRPLVHSLVAALMFSTSASPALAQSHDHAGMLTVQPHKPTAQENALVQAIRDATEQYKSVTSIEGPGHGYGLA